ncbi:FG-GAP repeat protein [Pseudomonas sp. NY15435]|uniref:FG-GAP repeat protein n=1 Tax=Pseudomonas sp. NY15435 TaxID=3400358 RepID=UPI003A85A716
MKHLIILAITIAPPQTALALECKEKHNSYQVQKCDNQKLCITNNDEKRILNQEVSDDDRISCADVNFDGYQDIIVTHPPSGQTQASSVFVYDKKDHNFRKNEELSKLPCLKIDSIKQRVSGTCFSSSNCDKWIEKYKFRPDGQLQITQIEGTYCDPTNGNTFSYTEIYKNSRIFSKHVKKLSD